MAPKPTHLQLTLAEEFIQKATPEQLERIAVAAQWYVITTIDGCRTDCSWFELKESVDAVIPTDLVAS